jgi:hypothetical protein
MVLLQSVAVPAHGFTMDARRLGMANAHVTGSFELHNLNPAYQSMPKRTGASQVVIPLPLGLMQVANDFPTFDVNDDNFSVTRIANLALNPPFFLELKEPSQLEGDITVFVARNAFAVSFEDAQALLPQKPFDLGGVWSTPIAGLGVHKVRGYVSPVIYLEGELAFDDAMYGVLAGGEPLLPNSTYGLNATGETMVGMSYHFGLSSALHADERGNGIYAGAFVKYLLGFNMSRGESFLSMATADTIFGSGNPMDVGYDSRLRYTRLGQVGHGIGVDAGIAYRSGSVDMGVGVRDLGSSVHWGRSIVERAWWDDATNSLESEVLATDASYTQKLPTQTTFNLAWTGGRTLLAADLTTSRLGTHLHFGAEQSFGPLAVRSGILTDKQGLQYAGGVGIGVERFWLDVGVQTHSRTITGERGVTLGTSVAVR